MEIIKNRLLRTFIFSIGCIAVALAFAGLFLPLLPTTPFLLVSAWCFLKSSAKAHQWLYNQKVLGRILRDWDEHKSIAVSTKIVAILMIAASLVLIWLKPLLITIKILLTVILVTVSVFIATRKSS